MKDDRLLKAEVKSALKACFSVVNDMPSLRYDIMRKVRGEKPVKKKLTTSLVLVIVMVLLAATALAVGLSYYYSSEVSAKSVARNAVMEKYSLSRDAMDMFWPEVDDSGKNRTVRFTAYDVYMEVLAQMGVYTVTIAQDGSVAVQWSHDNADPTTWADGSLDDAVWGNEQILAYRAMRDKENGISYAGIQSGTSSNESVSKVTPQQGKLTDTQVLGFASTAMKKTFGFTDETLTLFDAYAGLGEQEDGVWTIVYYPICMTDTLFRTEKNSPFGNYVVSISDETAETKHIAWSLEHKREGTYTQQTWGQAEVYSAELLPWVLDLVMTCTPLIEKGEASSVTLSVEDKAIYDQAFRDAGFDPGIYNHVLPQEGDISYNDAVEIVAQVLKQEFGVSRAVFDASGFAYADLTQEKDHREWYFWVQNIEEQCGWTVVFDAETGEILSIVVDPFANSNG